MLVLVGHRRVAFPYRSTATGYDHLRTSCAVGSLPIPVRLLLLVLEHNIIVSKQGRERVRLKEARGTLSLG
jgi:hypothetical protein